MSPSETQSAPRQEDTPVLSVAIPVYNEQDNVGPLHDEVRTVLEQLGEPYEIIFVNDGSTDRTEERLREIREGSPHLRIVNLAANSGEAAAVSAGFQTARGEFLITLDGDGQNDPGDIPRLLEALRRPGVKVATGRREERQEGFFLRVLPSRIANSLIALLSGVPVHDCGCGLKAYRRTALRLPQLPRGLHRFLPAILGVRPHEVVEIPTRDRARTSGASHYGIGRTVVVLRDLLALPFLVRNPRRTEVLAALATAACAGAAAVLVSSSVPTAVLGDVLAVLCGVVWWNARRFNRAQEDGVFRLRDDPV